MVKLKKLISDFLTELNAEEHQQVFNSLNVLLEHIENKNDPEPIELQIADSTYQLLEHLGNVQNLLKKYQKETTKNLPGNKLSSLYENNLTKGTNILFD